MSSNCCFLKFRIYKGRKQAKRNRISKKSKTPQITAQKKPKIRDRSGCFCCRKRKVKCIGNRPSCDNCSKGSYICVWPNGEESLSHSTEFKLIKIDQTRGKEGRKTETSARYTVSAVANTEKRLLVNESVNNNLTLAAERYEKPTTAVAIIKEKAPHEAKYRVHSEEEVIHEKIFYKFLIELNYCVADRSLSNTWNQSSLLYDAFVSGFMTGISPQITHFKLQPSSAFIPYGANNLIIRNLFASCGASFLYSINGNSEMKLMAQEKFHQSSNSLMEFVSDVNNILGNEGLIVSFLLLSYLKLRVSFGERRTKTLNIIALTELVKLWIFNKQKLFQRKAIGSRTSTEKWSGKSKVSSQTGEQIVKSIEGTFECLTYRIKNIFDAFELNKMCSFNAHAHAHVDSNRYIIDPSSFDSELYSIFNESNTEKIDIFPHERTIIESFVYNYSNSFFTCDKSLINEITSPFVIFDLLRRYLSIPIYKCAVPWMNNPVAGAALPSFELQAKVCWLALQTPLSSATKKSIESIRKASKYYIKPILPPEVHESEPSNVQRKLMESCYASEIISNAVFIYSSKILYPEMSIEDEEIKYAVNNAFQCLTKITMNSPIHRILTFALVVVGTSTTSLKDREYLMWKITKLQQVWHVGLFEGIERACLFAWNDMSIHQSVESWDVLFKKYAI